MSDAIFISRASARRARADQIPAAIAHRVLPGGDRTICGITSVGGCIPFDSEVAAATELEALVRRCEKGCWSRVESSREIRATDREPGTRDTVVLSVSAIRMDVSDAERLAANVEDFINGWVKRDAVRVEARIQRS